MAQNTPELTKHHETAAAAAVGSLFGQMLHQDRVYSRAMQTINAFTSRYRDQTGSAPPYPHNAKFECKADYVDPKSGVRVVDFTDLDNGKDVKGMPASYLQVSTEASQQTYHADDDPATWKQDAVPA